MPKRVKSKYPQGSPEAMIFAKVKREAAKAKRLESEAAEATMLAEAARSSANVMVDALKKLDPDFRVEDLD